MDTIFVLLVRTNKVRKIKKRCKSSNLRERGTKVRGLSSGSVENGYNDVIKGLTKEIKIGPERSLGKKCLTVFTNFKKVIFEPFY